MTYYYQVFGLTCASEVEIPAFLPVPASSVKEIDFQVKIGKVERVFEQEAQPYDDYTQMNSREFFMEVEEVARYFVKNGKEVTIEPLTKDWREVLLYFKSNGMAAILFQNGKIPFHTSGIIDHSGGVWLFSGDSGMGKSTTALKLKERGYALFTDDTALLYVENGKCLARASYPMVKAWPQTIDNQIAFEKRESFPILKDWEKQGVFFHEKFMEEALEVKGIVFLKTEGEEIVIRPLKALEGMMQLIPNVYRGEWVTALNQNKLQFVTASEIANVVSFCEAIRPENAPTYEAFAAAIDENIIRARTEVGKSKCLEKVI
jgi:hypothetical protein